MNRRQFTKFYQANVERIYRYVFFRTGRHKDIAEDLVADIFMKAFEHFETYDPKISQSAWIYRIAHNRIANYWRDHKPTVEITDDTMDEELHSEKDHRDRINALDLERILARLNADERQLITLKHLAGYSYAMMAEILDRSADGVKVATYRAMQKMKSLCLPSKK